MAAQTKLTDAFYILISDGKRRPENRISRRERHYSTLP
jgi:hypothetical protein